jgi:hypothetical protein
MHAAKANILQSVFFPHIIDDAFIDAIMAHVTETVRELDVSDMRRRKAQKLIEATACQAVADMWTSAFRKNFKVTRSWPQATAILLDNPPRAVIEIWIGHEYHDADIPEPIEVFFDGE